MIAMNYIKIIGLSGDRSIDTDPGNFEVFEGITSEITSDLTTSPENSEIPPIKPEDTKLEEAIAEFQAFFTTQMQNIEQAPDLSRSMQKRQTASKERGLPVPVPGSGGLPDLFRAIMLFVPGWVTKYAAIAEELAPVVQAIKDAVSVGSAIREFFVGTDFENAFLEPYAWYDIFRLWPESKLTRLAEIRDAIEAIEPGNTEGIVGAIQDLALQEIEVKFGDNQALRIKAQLLRY